MKVKNKHFFLFLLILLFCTSTHAASFDDFNVNSLAFVDEYEGNYLYRGNFPGWNHAFGYDQLVDAIQKDLEKRGKKGLASDFLLYDLSLLNCFDYEERNEEEKFFKNQEKKGVFINYPLYGMLYNPSQIDSYIRNFYLSYPIDGLAKLMEMIRKELKDSKNKVIYIHCHSGYDRTGEAVGSYLMEFKGVSYEEVLKANETLAHRPLKFNLKNAMKWYAYYLRDLKRIETVGKID